MVAIYHLQVGDLKRDSVLRGVLVYSLEKWGWYRDIRRLFTEDLIRLT